MKLSDFLSDVGRPVAFYPGLVKALEDRNEAIFICQMAYWRGKEQNADGWIYKTSEEIERETSLTYKEQSNVREGLKEKGLLEEHYARTEHKMYFKVNWDKVNEIWEHFTDGQVLSEVEHITAGKVAPSPKSTGSLPKVISLNSNTENTTKTTHRGEGISEIIDHANKKVDFILENEKKVKYQNRDKLPEPYLRFADLYNELTGQEPTKRVIMDWMQTFEEWKQEGLQPENIRAAWQYANRPEGGFPVGRPGALTNTAVAMKSKGFVQKSAASVSPLEQALFDLQKANAHG